MSHICESVQEQIVGIGIDIIKQIWYRGPYAVIRHMKVRAAAQPRQMDAVTHACSRGQKSSLANTWLQSKCHHKQEGSDEHMGFFVTDYYHLWLGLQPCNSTMQKCAFL